MHARVAVGKVHTHHIAKEVKSGKVNDYVEYYFRINTERAKELGLKADEYYILAMMPAEWYDLLDLDRKGRLYKALPEDVRKHVDWLKRAEEEGVEIV